MAAAGADLLWYCLGYFRSQSNEALFGLLQEPSHPSKLQTQRAERIELGWLAAEVGAGLDRARMRDICKVVFFGRDFYDASNSMHESS